MGRHTGVVLELQVIDAFADEAFTGNPAAVTILDAFPTDEWMGKVAQEMNLSETAFVVPRQDGGYDLRWFTPQTEVDLCGHATLASAHVLGGDARFHTRSGVLTCRKGPGGLIEMDFPEDPPSFAAVDLALPGADLVWSGRGRTDVLLEVSDAGWVRRYVPDFGAISALDARCVILTATGDRDGVDFVSRVFGPRVGVNEDPVTGSAHCTLAGHWSRRTGRSELVGFQASPRGGTVHTRVDRDRVVLSGRAVTVSDVRMRVNPPPA